MANDRYLTCEHLIEGFDDYLDGHEGALPRAAVDAHLAHCQTCPALVADFRAIRQTARTLEPIVPPEHVWRHVRARVTLETPVRTSLLDRLGWRGWLQPASALAGIALVVSSLAWIGTRLTPPVQPAGMADGAGVLAGFQLAESEYTDAIDSLEEAAAEAGPRLDPVTTATLRSSLDDIDLAIVDAREALALQPGDRLSQEHLLDALGSKVALLQDTVAMLDLEPATEVQNP